MILPIGRNLIKKKMGKLQRRDTARLCVSRAPSAIFLKRRAGARENINNSRIDRKTERGELAHFRHASGKHSPSAPSFRFRVSIVRLPPQAAR